jgi:hypothetical protein
MSTRNTRLHKQKGEKTHKKSCNAQKRAQRQNQRSVIIRFTDQQRRKKKKRAKDGESPHTHIHTHTHTNSQRNHTGTHTQRERRRQRGVHVKQQEVQDKKTGSKER